MKRFHLTVDIQGCLSNVQWSFRFRNVFAGLENFENPKIY